MANLKNVASAFLDGFGSLGFLFERAERPGSRDNLISNVQFPGLDSTEMTEAILSRDVDVPGIVSQLRKSADLIEDRYKAMNRIAIHPSGTAHGR